jgi:hypothetical protein
MDERSRAAYYRLHKDDPNEWDDGEEPEEQHERDRMTASITVRFSPAEASLIRQAAKSHRISYSELVRTAVTAYLQPEISPERPNITYDVGRRERRFGGTEVTLGGTLADVMGSVTGPSPAP